MGEPKDFVPPAQEWQAEWLHTLPELEELTKKLKPRRDVHVMRSSQLDAAMLDDELISILKEQFMKTFALFKPGMTSALQPELNLILDLLIFRLSIWSGGPLPGMNLMNLRFRDENNTINKASCEGPALFRHQRVMYGLGAVALRYAWQRAGHALAASQLDSESESSWNRQLWKVYRAAESVHRITALANFIVFLRHGKYRSVLERLIGARLVYAQPSAPRILSFEYLNRQLVWHEISELLLFTLPLVNVSTVKRALKQYLPRLPMLSLDTNMHSQYQQRNANSCGVCGTTEILTPYLAQPCGHTFCYYCLRGHLQADSEYTCPHCLVPIESMKRA